MSTPTSKSLRRTAFIREFIKNPLKVGACAPSGRHLAEAMMSSIDPQGSQVIVEYGPGTGAFTDQIMKRLTPKMTYFAVELTPTFAQILRDRYPAAHIHTGSVADIEQFCVTEGLPAAESIDLIISGLPWASFPGDLQRSILDPLRRVLKPGGKLVTFGYHIGKALSNGRLFYRTLPEYFSKIEQSPLIWRNVWPAWVFTCTK